MAAKKKGRSDSIIKLLKEKKESKLRYDEAVSHIKTGNYLKALDSFSRYQCLKMYTFFHSNILDTERDSELINSFVSMNMDNKEGEDPKPPDENKEKDQNIHLKVPQLVINPEPQIFECKEENEEDEDVEEKPEDNLELKRKMSTSSFESKRMRKLSAKQIHQELKKHRKKKRQRGRKQEEIYTDKDRAAAVGMGSKDIKVDLRTKRRQERSKNLSIPELAEPENFIALGNHKAKLGKLDLAMQFYNKALELSPQDKNGLVARSQCYILLGNPSEALKDAETALEVDKNFTKAIYQKAEALYYLGEFEHSLVYYHRGLRIRPDLEKFQLGVHKAQKAIENAIGSSLLPKKSPTPDMKGSSVKSTSSRSSRSSTRMNTIPKQLCVEMRYLDNLLKHPDIVSKISTDSDVTKTIKETVDYLNTRKEFWRQQLPP